jgi:glutamine---fructose-6-phosphate transaminase (isomerizing)
MCGIFGIVAEDKINSSYVRLLSSHAETRGSDSSGLCYFSDDRYKILRTTEAVTSIVNSRSDSFSKFMMGHSRLITNGLSDNQPVQREDIILIHNGIIVNHKTIWESIDELPHQEIDSEVIAAIVSNSLKKGESLETATKNVLDFCKGVVACAFILPKQGKLVLFSNNGSLYTGRVNESICFSSDSYPLKEMGCNAIKQVKKLQIIDIPKFDGEIKSVDRNFSSENLIPALGQCSREEQLLHYEPHQLQRCTKCILPETMPYISFDPEGVCNYCNNYKPRNNPKPLEDLFDLVEPYRRNYENDCVVPFSGGRDSCFGLHLIVKELKMKPLTYTYDWGMVTDLGRRNISRMCGELGVENIIVAADIKKKRNNIRKNLLAWLKSPNLGMISILTAGDKHFFKYVETIKRQSGINLNLWGVNPLEVTHFKSGFLGVKPDFEEELVYSHGIFKQIRYQFLRLRAMSQSLGYFNSSLWDTISGEYYRSFTEKSDYFHLFDYWRWDEGLVNDTLDLYDWEKAPDTSTTWRIGDGTAAFYNYIYYKIAGFTEHDTFRSNQIREGDISREEALKLVADENQPRYPNIKWYLDAVNLDFETVISKVNQIPSIFN